MKQLCLLSPWTLDSEVYSFKVFLWFWQILGQALGSFTQKVAKVLWNLVWGEHFQILMNFSNVLTDFIAEWHVHVYVSSTFPHPEQLDFSLKKCLLFHLLCQSLAFFPLKGCAAFGHVLTKHLFLTSFWLNIFEVFLLEGPMPSSYRNGIRQQQTWVRLFHMSTQAVLDTLLYWRTLFYVFPLLFILVEWTSFSLSKIHTHWQHFVSIWNFFKWQKKEKALWLRRLFERTWTLER